MSEKWRDFNINHNVKVELTDLGREIMLANHNKLYEFHRDPPEFVPPKADEDGLVSFQLWDLMREFGAHMSCGMNVPFRAFIRLDTGDLEPLPASPEEKE